MTGSYGEYSSYSGYSDYDFGGGGVKFTVTLCVVAAAVVIGKSVYEHYFREKEPEKALSR